MTMTAGIALLCVSTIATVRLFVRFGGSAGLAWRRPYSGYSGAPIAKFSQARQAMNEFRDLKDTSKYEASVIDEKSAPIQPN
jgi:hypothetical protein